MGVPPASTAAIASNVSVPPELTLADVLKAAVNMAVTANSAPAPNQATVVTPPTGRPAARAAGLFSPTR